MADDDSEAFRSLFQRYWEDLFITAAKTLRGREGAEDVVQEVFSSLWARRHTLVIKASLSAYLHTSVRYHALHFIEKNMTRKDYLIRLSEVEMCLISVTPADRLEIKEIEENIKRTVECMPPRMQEIYILSRDNYLSHKEISERLGISSETVKKQVRNALQLIRKSIFNEIIGVIALMVSLFK